MPSDAYNQNNTLNINERVAKRFTDITNISLDTLAPNITQVADKIVAALLNENKIIICASGSSIFLSQYMASELIHRFETDRPALPAIALMSNTSVISSFNEDSFYDEMYARQIQALGQNDDILIIFVSSELANNIVSAIEAAHEKNIQIILICAETSEDVSNLLDINDHIIQIASNKQSHVLEIQLLTLHCICDLIDHLLFGTP
jgi:D-sedoheptulose 7-phosphate isomerase